jgi:hypothetical protein
MKTIFSRTIAALLPLIVTGLVVQAQSALPYVIAGAGGTGTLPNGTTFNFTLGEPFITTVGIGTAPRLTQGFQQPTTTNTPLSIELLDFTGSARPGYNLLIWHTAQEKNNDYFDVERSRDGIDFTGIGRVPSSAINGNSNTTIAYSLPDKNVPEGVSYYRLKQVDKDGQSSQSITVRLELVPVAKAQHFTLSPNPTTGKVYFAVTAITDGSFVQVYDANGKEIKQVKLTNLTTEIDMERLSSGTYFILYNDGRNREWAKVVRE